MLCIHAPTWGYGPALEHNGDLCACDHFVAPACRLGTIHETHILERVASPQQRRREVGRTAGAWGRASTRTPRGSGRRKREASVEIACASLSPGYQSE
jgi:hypothetical protein